jgi:phenylpropionate dioxygenase-like ring-hydroxylating dioxygenase large terminal subunit
MTKVWLEDLPFVLYRNAERRWQLVYDVCPHQGASLYRGELTNKKCLVCPYHGFRFVDGELVHPLSARGSVLSLHVKEDSTDGTIYFLPWVDKNLSPGYNLTTEPIFHVPESTDEKFSRIDGYRVVDTSSMVLTENVLDMLHISYVHSFGNRAEPFPFDIRYQKIDDNSGRTVFMYHSGPTSISKRIAGKDIITVENEYHLPSTTVTRVRAGDLVKTIVTRTVPYRDGKTGFFYTIFYNFHRGLLMDLMLRWSMEKTIEEDMSILRHVYAGLRTPLLNTKYDKTILAFRKSRQKAMEAFLDVKE